MQAAPPSLRKPDRLTYGVDDRPPRSAICAVALQQAVLVLVFMIYPVAAAQAMGLSPEQTTSLVTATLMAVALATALQSRRPPVGSGMLAVQIPTPVMLPAVVQAGMAGGLGLIAGMTLVLALGEAVVARLLKPLRACFPPEVCGVVVLMLGVSIAEPALKNVTGAVPDAAGLMQPNFAHLAVGVGTLLVVMAAALFGRGPLRLFALGCGLVAGASLSWALGLVEPASMAAVNEAGWIGWPHIDVPRPIWDPTFVPLFVLMALINSVDNLGVLVGIQRMIDADWKRIDTRAGAGGLQASAVGDVAAGLLGGVPGGVSSAHAGLIFATGAASRCIAPLTAAILCMALFTPKTIALLALIPKPVIGALMVYTAAYMIVSGMELIQSRLLSERRMLTVGLSVLMGLCPLVLPGIFRGLPDALAPVFESSLALSALSAILLTLLFRIGVTDRAVLSPDADPFSFEALQQFLDRQGKLWGARPEIIDQALQASAEAMEALSILNVSRESVRYDARFDEESLDVTLTYQGPVLECPSVRPFMTQTLDDEQALARMAGYVVRRSVDRLSQSSEGERQTLSLHFEH